MNFSLRYVLITSFIIIKTVIKHLKQAGIRCFGWCIKRYCVKQRCNHKIKKTFKIIVFVKKLFLSRGLNFHHLMFQLGGSLLGFYTAVMERLDFM